MSSRTRTIIAGSSGRVLLSIPIVGGRSQKCIMRDVLIDNSSRWKDNHWKTIFSCYKRSPWFDHYSDEVRDLFKTRCERLMDWNNLCLEWTLQKLGLNVSVSLTEDWREHYTREQGEDWRGRFQKRELWERPVAVKYRQVFEERTGFLPHISILDLLFCEGKNAVRILYPGGFSQKLPGEHLKV